MINKKLQSLIEKLKENGSDSSDQPEILNLSDSLAQNILGGSGNATCTNLSCSNSVCTGQQNPTNNGCTNLSCLTPDMTNSGCTNQGCNNLP